MKSLAGCVITLMLGVLTGKLGYTFIWCFAAASLLLSNVALVYFLAGVREDSCSK